MSQRYDVIVAGSGPAGGTAAYFLGEAGKRVLMLEKETLPRYKACGGAVSLSVLQQFPFSFEPVIQSRIDSVTYASGERTVTVPLKDCPLCMVMRDEFDAYLARRARADLREGLSVKNVEETPDSVQVETVDGQSFEADYLIAADGANSTVARSLNLRRKKVMAGAIEIEAKVPAAIQRRYARRLMLIIGDVGVGYLWVFPKGDHVSVGVGGLNPKPQELQGALERVMDRLGISLEGQPRHGHPVPIHWRPERIQTRRTLLAGDAAGLVDPFTGEGIRFAIKSGRLAADSILGGRPERYSALVSQRIGRNHRLGKSLNPIFYGHPRGVFDHLLRRPLISQKLIQMLDDQLSYGRLIWNLILESPKLIMEKKVPLDSAAGVIPVSSVSGSEDLY